LATSELYRANLATVEEVVNCGSSALRVFSLPVILPVIIIAAGGVTGYDLYHIVRTRGKYFLREAEPLFDSLLASFSSKGEGLYQGGFASL